MHKHSHNYTKISLENSKNLRSNMTPFEEKLWYYLRAKRFCNLKFRRQVPIGNYIVDFICKDKMLVIELDGSGHLEIQQITHDDVIRIYNNDIENNIDGVLEFIKNHIK